VFSYIHNLNRRQPIPTEAIEKRQSHRIKELARRFPRLVNEAREEVEAWRKTLVIKTYTASEGCEK
jgi:hypothetical protein